ncbi:tetratricopeptide repeat protein [Glaciecola sp. XM2]|jgi:predicted negative regulator of RcsB-dependent stress response|uniref:YfgM family protein n=1 Tax=Glaciecola sp. XM2 TaxID=1914931 RepID=UPI001BDE6D47|nr:tetratricopeptide repeat protein [Glaciecola sp. XM2]MBT1452375.1 tetratricopeptide repeat protein [Glaciecola sp. XM2]
MERFETEEQQIEAIKGFWKENGMVIVLGALLGLGGLWGWRAYNDNVISSKEAASSAYTASIEQFVESEEIDALSAFVNENEGTGYAPLASMIVAQQAIDKSDYETAIKYLTIAASDKGEVADVAKLRLAAVHLEVGEFSKALVQLDAVTSASFEDQVQELKGDVLYAQGEFDQAKEAYNLALLELPNDANIKMKLDNIAFAKTQAVSANSEQ